MLPHWLILLVSFGYLGLLFAIAYYGDKRADAGRSVISNPYIYTFSIAVYCTGWTFYGSVGRAASHGIGFLPIYLGPALAATVWWLLLRKIIRLTKANHITSIADFVASRYGKSAVIGGLVTLVAVIGILPYIALQLKAISESFSVLFHHHARSQVETGIGHDTALYVALILALFSILFGTRHLDVTERHEGMVAAIAFESIVKLVAFTAVGAFVTWSLFDGPADLFGQAAQLPETARLMGLDWGAKDYASWAALLFISMAAIMFLPRQFQILVVENVNEEHVRTASWLFPLYLLAINLFVLPIAIGGLLISRTGAAGADMFVLTLPLQGGRELLALFAFIGGLSAATGMVIVETISLSTMVCNDLMVPFLLRFNVLRRERLAGTLIQIRRGSILFILLLGYLYFRLIGESYALVSIGLVSFVAAAQFAPAILLGIYWKGASRRGVLAGLGGGFLVWAYTLLLPSFAGSGWLPRSFVEPGPFGIAALGPYHLLGLVGFDPITHAVFWTLLCNVGLLVGVSLFGRQGALEQLQAAIFVDTDRKQAGHTRLWHGTTQVRDLRELVARMLGTSRAEQAFGAYAARHGVQLHDEMVADESLVAFAERELARAVGAASARVMVSSIIEGEELSIEGLMRILDETSQVLEYSRRLEEKSRELEEATRELQRTNVRLTELDRMKDEFVSTVSHELRTPLSSIRAFSEILQDEPEMDPRQRQELSGIVVQETQRLTRLVEQIMDFTKIEAGPDSWGHENLDLVGVVNEAIAATSQLSRNRNMEVVCELPDGPVAVVGDRDRLLQVVINLLSNALKYCEPGVGRVHLSLTPLPGEVRVEVADNGPGIRPEEHERIFEKFHQIRSAATGKPQGAGLGLAICKTIIEGHGGRIWVESQPGSGARFIFTLPRGSEGGAPGAEAARASLLAGLLAFSILVAPGAAAGAGGILAVGIRGPISPSVAEHVERAVGAGRERQVSLLVIELDTPGGLDASMRVITQAILNAPYPVAVHVAPPGARAASAGTFITLAADVAAMAPGTTIGAAHPVNLIGGGGDATTTAKAVSDSAAYARSLAERHGRNGDWAEKAVRESASLTETQALKEKVIDLVAPDLDGLLSALEGRELQRPEGTVVLHTRGKPVARLPMDWRRRVLDWLSDPTIAYLLLMLGMLGIFFELSHPGVILPGVVGVISLILAFYALQSLPVSGAGLLLILLALILFFAELQVVSHGILGLGGVIALTLGSVMLVRSPAAWLRVSFFAIVPMVAATSLFFLVVLRLALKARRRPTSTGREGMVGAAGEALEDLAPAGNVFVHGETWGARSPETVRKGDRVRVIAVRGLTLEVRKDREE